MGTLGGRQGNKKSGSGTFVRFLNPALGMQNEMLRRMLNRENENAIARNG
jgi:hypothetical protein